MFRKEIIDLNKYKENHLLFWKQNGAKFPHLSKTARMFLCIPITSAESERVFS